MTIDWLLLVCGLALGLVPPQLLIKSEVRYLHFDTVWTRIAGKDPTTRRRRRWWKLPLVWIDPVRGYVVAQFISDAFRALPHANHFLRLAPLLCVCLCLAIVLLVQTGGRAAQEETVAPCGFLAGMLVPLLPLIVVVCAIALGAAMMIATKRFAAGFITAALVTGVLGYVFLRAVPRVACCAFLVSVPFLVSWFRARPLVMPMRT